MSSGDRSGLPFFEIEEHAFELSAHCNIAGRDIFQPVSKDRRLLTQLKDGGLQRNDVSGVQLVMKVGLRVYDGKRHLPSTNFFWAKTKTDHDAEHAVANCRE